jgi:hypothetical protein
MFRAQEVDVLIQINFKFNSVECSISVTAFVAKQCTRNMV